MSKKVEQTSFPPSSDWDQLCVIEQSAEVADRWDIKPHWHGDIGAFSARKLETTVWTWRSNTLLTIDKIDIGL